MLTIAWPFAIFFISDLSSARLSRRIYGGRAVEPGQLPFVVRIEHFDEDIQEQLHCCTGSLIKPTWVLAAAHCEVCVSLGLVRVRHGDVDARWNETNAYSNFVRLITHPGYRADPYRLHQDELLTDELLRHFIYQNDIALFEFEQVPLPVGKVSAVEFTTAIGKEAAMAGYGIMALRPILVDNTLALSQPLQYSVVLMKPCEQSLVVNSFPIICVAHECEKGDNGQVIMPGDSGGPLMFDGKILGVCSYGFHALHGKRWIIKETGFYTAVSPYLDWIKLVTEPTEPVESVEVSDYNNTSNEQTTMETGMEIMETTALY